MHWFIAFVIVDIFLTLINETLQRNLNTIYAILINDYRLSLHGAFNLIYFFGIVYVYALRFLWIRLTYKRYAFATVWRIYTVLTLFTNPVYAFVANLRDFAANNLESYHLLSAWHLIISLALVLLPIAYFLHAIRKAVKSTDL